MAARLLRLARCRPPTSGATHAKRACATLTMQQQLVEEVVQTEQRGGDATKDAAAAEPDPVRAPCSVLESREDIEHMVGELLHGREAHGDDAAATSAELTYQAMLQNTIEVALVRRLSADCREPQTDSETAMMAEVAAVLTSLCVRPSPPARALAFECLLRVVSATTVEGAFTHSLEGECSLHDQLLSLTADMIHKSVAVAGSGVRHSEANGREELAWMQAAVACVMSLTRCQEGDYRLDRLSRLDPTALVFLLRCAYSLMTECGQEAHIQELLLEVVISAMYSRHSGQKKSSDARKMPITGRVIPQPNIDRFGGVDLYASIFFTTSSEWSRRMVFVLFWDFAVAMVDKDAPQERNEETQMAIDQVLEQLLRNDLLKVLLYANVRDAGDDARARRMFARGDYAESTLNQVDSVWKSLRSILQVDEFIGPLTSLQKTLRAVSASLKEQPASENAADVMAMKAKQLLARTNRLEDRLKGERWLAELLLFGLKDLTERSTHGLLAERRRPSSSDGADGGLDEAFCVDEGADLRQSARETLWRLLKSGLTSERLSGMRVLRQVVSRLVMSTTSVVVLCALATELADCVSVCLTADPSIALATCAADTILKLAAVDSVPYLDRRQQAYDMDCYETPRELVGVFVNSDSVSSKLLRGHISVDHTVLDAIPIGVLLQLVTMFDSSLHPQGTCRGGCCGIVASFAGDCMAATALLVSFQVQSMVTSPGVELLQPLQELVDACDSRVAVITARAATRLVRLELGEPQYMESLRELHARSADAEEEVPLVSAVGVAKAMMQCLLAP